MRLGNCYLFAIRRYRERGGWIVLRRSTKARYIIHAQWGAAGLDVGAEPIGLWAGLRRIVGPSPQVTGAPLAARPVDCRVVRQMVIRRNDG